MVEVLLCLGILAMVLVPVVDLFTSFHRVSTGASRLVEVALHGQTLVEALAQMDPADLPELPAGTSRILIGDGQPDPAGAAGRLAAFVEYFHRRPPADVTRTITMKRLATGELAYRIQLEWLAITGDARTRQRVEIPVVGVPRNWQ